MKTLMLRSKFLPLIGCFVPRELGLTTLMSLKAAPILFRLEAVTRATTMGSEIVLKREKRTGTGGRHVQTDSRKTYRGKTASGRGTTPQRS